MLNKGLIVFKKNQTEEILRRIGVEIIIEGDKKIILNELGAPATCECCKKSLSFNNIGNIAKGSNLLFCENPYCFGSHLAKKLFNE
ncbi:hypothetical protein KAS08_01250 [Candidatus Pacearchaeota archaeon]|nr:hypothetical protein [Candidatus Pacearchaeota archaeon]